MIRRKERGFSLIELSLILAVAAAFSVIGLIKYTVGKENERKNRVMTQMRAIQDAVLAYADQHGYYPCPAAVLGIDENGFGNEARGTDGWCDTTVLKSSDSAVNDSEYFTDYFTHLPDPPYNTSWSFPNAYYDSGNTSAGNEMLVRDVDIVKGDPPCSDLGLAADCMMTPEGYRLAYVTIPELARAAPCGGYVVRNVSDVGTGGRPALDDGDGVTDTGDVHYIPSLGIFKDYNLSQDLATNAAVPERLHQSDPDFAIVYYGKDGIGAYDRSGLNFRVPDGVADDAVAGSGTYSALNYDANDVPRRFYFSPVTPLPANAAFDDIVVFGRSDNVTGADMKLCMHCQFWGSGTDDIVRMDTVLTQDDAEVTPVCLKGPKRLAFNGVDERIHTTTMPSQISAQSGSISFWMEADTALAAVGNRSILGVGSTTTTSPHGSGVGISLRRHNNYHATNMYMEMQIIVNGGAVSPGNVGVAAGTTTPIVAGTKYFVVITSNGTVNTMYINGVAQTLSNYGWSPMAGRWWGDNDLGGVKYFSIGSAFRSNAWSAASMAGKVDEVALWDIRLSAAQVAELYNAGVPTDLSVSSVAANLQNWWKMGEGEIGNMSEVKDSIGGLHLVPVNMDTDNILEVTYP